MTEVKRYRKKPVEISAYGPISSININDIAYWCGGRVERQVKPSDPSDVSLWITIPTLEGPMRADSGDYVIKGVVGEFYPCKPVVFAQTYELIEDKVKQFVNGGWVVVDR